MSPATRLIAAWLQAYINLQREGVDLSRDSRKERK
jgi:hypothetical protein